LQRRGYCDLRRDGFASAAVSCASSGASEKAVASVRQKYKTSCGAGNSHSACSRAFFGVPVDAVATAKDEGGQVMNRHDLARQLTGWRQTTAEILYRMPDHPALVQTFLWQDMDRWHADPRLTYPRLRQFCKWWNANLDGAIVQVRVAAKQLVSAGEVRHVGIELRLN